MLVMICFCFPAEIPLCAECQETTNPSLSARNGRSNMSSAGDCPVLDCGMILYLKRNLMSMVGRDSDILNMAYVQPAHC